MNTLSIDRDAAIRRFDELWEILNSPDRVDDSGKPANPILDVAVFMDLNASHASFLAERFSADELYSATEIRNGKFTLRKEYKRFQIKGVERRQAATAWKRWFKEQTAPPPKPKKPRAPRKRKGGVA